MNAKTYRNTVRTKLQSIFPAERVEREWDPVRYDPHFSNHKEVYAPRHDLAVGPFNSYADLDCGIDNTKRLWSHRFTQGLIREKLQGGVHRKELWNSFSRCFLAVELEFSGSSKHVFRSIVNASVSGSLAIIVAKSQNRDKVDRIVSYLFRLESLERLRLKTIANLFVFSESEFVEFLSTFET